MVNRRGEFRQKRDGCDKTKQKQNPEMIEDRKTSNFSAFLTPWPAYCLAAPAGVYSARRKGTPCETWGHIRADPHYKIFRRVGERQR